MLVFFNGFGQWLENLDDGRTGIIPSGKGRFPGVYRLPPEQSLELKHNHKTMTNFLFPAIGHPDAPYFQQNQIPSENLDRVLFGIIRSPSATFTTSDIIPEEPEILIPNYNDPNHPLFSPELSIAIETWKAVLASNPVRPKTGSRKKLIVEYPRLRACIHKEGRCMRRVGTGE